MAGLDRRTSDEKVRAIGVTGMGGLGKTSLIGHWLKKRGGTGKRPVNGLFYWSFYANRDVSEFLEGLRVFSPRRSSAVLVCKTPRRWRSRQFATSTRRPYSSSSTAST